MIKKKTTVKKLVVKNPQKKRIGGMTPEEWLEHYRNMKPSNYMDSMGDALIHANLEKCIAIVHPNDAEEIRKHVKKCIDKSVWYALGD